MLKIGHYYIVNCIFDILSFGFVPNSDTLQDQYANQRAILQAIRQENSSKHKGQCVYQIIFFTQCQQGFKTNYGQTDCFQKCINMAEIALNAKIYQDFISFRRSTHIQISGGGKIDGRGFHTCVILFHNDKQVLPDLNGRPILQHFINYNFTSVHDLVLKNSPRFHLKYRQCHDGTVYSLDIKVNPTAQINLIKRFANGPLIMYPFNTDGIDPSGARFHIYNITVQNFDDFVVPKPLDETFDCTRDMLIQNATVKFGIRMSIGSLSPLASRDCIRNITARNWRMIRPIKSIYIWSTTHQIGYSEQDDQVDYPLHASQIYKSILTQ